MKLYIDGDISRYYVQTLCMIFFPGAKFPENEEFLPGGDEVTVNLRSSEGTYDAEVIMRSGGKSCVGRRCEIRGGIDSDERLKKRAVGKALYDAGSEMFGFSPDWGILTGVRPAKLAAELMRLAETDGYADPAAEAERILMQDYCASADKAKLLTTVARNEERLIGSFGENTCSVYISIPFCPTRCAYCSFVSYSTKRLLSLIPQYVERICTDIERLGRTLSEIGQKPSTVYIGGGTPTILDVSQIEIILRCIDRNIDLSGVREFTLEAGRPDTITPEKLIAAKSGGVSRISINPQTTNDEILKAIGRAHTSEEFLRAYESADSVGFKCINTDLIAGLPGESYDSFVRSMDTVSALAPRNITVHTFCVKKSAELHDNSSSYSRTGTDAGRAVAYSQLKANADGYLPDFMYKQKNSVGSYENVGFSKPGYEGLYNILIMDEVHSIFAAGAGAVTKLVSRSRSDIERLFMPKYPYEYLSGDACAAYSDYESKVLDFYRNTY